jgi:hypothetical protein
MKGCNLIDQYFGENVQYFEKNVQYFNKIVQYYLISLN